MIFCAKCGKECPDDARFCVECGSPIESAAPVVSEPDANQNTEPAAEPVFEPVAETASTPSPVGDTDAQQNVLNTMYRLLKYQRLAWKIAGIVVLVECIFIISLWFLFSVLNFAIAEEEMLVVNLIFGIYYALIGVLLIPIPIVNLAMSKKADKAMNELYFNVRPAANHCSAIPMIVVGALFNEIALVFIIINFVYTRKNKAVIDQIEYNQSIAGNAHRIS